MNANFRSLTTRLLAIFICCFASSAARAQLQKEHSFKALCAKADVVVVATVTKSAAGNADIDLAEHGITGKFASQVTTFSVLQVLQGKEKSESISVLHYAKIISKEDLVADAPEPLIFKVPSKEKKQVYLLFLTAQDNQKPYALATGYYSQKQSVRLIESLE